MAKERRKDDFIDEPADEPAGPVAAPAPEKEAPAARLAVLEKERVEHMAALRRMADRLEELEGRAREAPPPGPAFPPGTSYWKVEVEHGPAHVVRAGDPANAWEQYRAELGVIATEHRHQVVPAGREDYRAAQARRHGKRPEEWTLPDD